MAMSLGQSAGSRAAYRHFALRSQQLSGQHARRLQTCRSCTSTSLRRHRAPLLCKASQEEQPSADEQDRLKSSLDASCSGDEGRVAESKGPRERWQLASWLQSSKQQASLKLFSVAAASAGFLGIFGDLSGPRSTVEAVAVLAAIVGIHECGHFIAARAQGIHVTKFSIGFGPPLLSYQGKEVEYSLRAIPLGGYVAFPDDDPESKFPADDPDLLKNRSIPQRALVISAGVLANIIFAYSLLFTQVATQGVPETYFRPGVAVPEVNRNSPAAAAGLKRGDIILKLQDIDIPANPAAVPGVVRYITDHPEKKIDFTVLRNGQISHIPVTPTLSADGSGRIGVSLAVNAKIVRKAANGLGDAAQLAATEFGRLTGIVVGGLQQIVTNFEKSKESLSGPVAIVAVGAEVARSDVANLFQFAAILNINLAVINILPLPALDGGYLALLVAEAVRGKKLPQGVEQGIMASGFLLITGVGLLLVFRDALNLALGSSPM
ncbi:g9051 [Coccomyxa viridis]|uniref:G9051 protein n=1 Tax=Coccomyxa viridis TaxID=1274662 RepID=A0ABP1G1X1_9CHLO